MTPDAAPEVFGVPPLALALTGLGTFFVLALAIEQLISFWKLSSGTRELMAEVMALGGADVVYDPVGGALFDAALRACNPEARLLPLGFASGTVPQIPANYLLVKNLTVLGFYWGGYTRVNPRVLTDSFAVLFDWYAAGRLTPHVSHVLPLEQANDGLELLRTRAATGKVVIGIGM